MKRAIIAGLLLCGLGEITFAQRRDYVNQTLATGLNGSTTLPYTSAPVLNVGQVFHQLVVLGTNAPSHTCIDPTVYALLEGSYDDVIYVPITTVGLASPTVTGVNKGYIAQGQSAPWPYIRAVLKAFDSTNCVVSISYTGSIYPNSLFIAPSQGVINQFQTTIASIVDAGAGIATVQAAGTTNATVVMYGLTFTNQNATDDVLTIGYGAFGGCGALTATKFTYVIKANSTLTIYPSNTPILYPGSARAGLSVCAQYGAVAGRNTSILVTSRFE